MTKAKLFSPHKHKNLWQLHERFHDFQLLDCWLEVSIQKVLQLATLAQVFLCFPLSISERWDGAQDSKLLLHAAHVALPT